MSTSVDKKRNYAQQKSKSAINNSTTKALYSFSKAQRFPSKMYRSTSQFRTYDIDIKKYDKRISFTTTKRTDFCKNDGVPGPTTYNPIDHMDKRLSVQFKNGRQQCKANSIFQANYNPGPGEYQPKSQNKYKTIYYSLRKKTQIKQPQGKQSPGPIYNIQSTLLDKNKYLSIYVRRSSTKICQPRTCFSRRRRQNTQPVNQKPKDGNQTFYITRNGGRQFGKSGPYPIQTHSKRLFQYQRKQTNPGPGHYSSFSEFIDDDVKAF